MSILELRILPPLAIARLGAAKEPLDAFELETTPDKPLDYRRIVPRPSFIIDTKTGEITGVHTPDNIRFKDENKNLKINAVAKANKIVMLTTTTR